MSDENKGPDENREGNDLKKAYTWKDIFAFTIAMYRILLPQLFLTLLVIAVLVYLLFWLWFN